MLAFKLCKAELTASVCYLTLFSSSRHLRAFPVHDTEERQGSAGYRAECPAFGPVDYQISSS